MENIWFIAAAWMGIALLASFISIRLGISVALIEIFLGVIGGNFLSFHTTPWIDFLASFGSILLTFLAGAATVGEMDEAKEFANHYFQEAFSVAYLRALKVGVELRTEIRAGHAARTIIDFTAEGGFDLVVLGSSEHSKVWAMFLGTTAEKVSRHVPCTVLLVR